MQKKYFTRAFTLVELLVAIAIIAVILAVAIPNLVGARVRARDAKRKAEVRELKQALRMYYNDYQKYPDIAMPLGIKGCGADGTTQCGSSVCSGMFAAGGSGCDIIYMKQFPSEFGSRMIYKSDSTGDDFRLYVTLENLSDPDLVGTPPPSQTRCSAIYGASYSTYSYVVCAD